ncbi:MAG: hypothetical protein II263_08660, partial [Lachnospiraceae bacterium]|nr:hypothetical protein [Lachnospiraceae bacterium]
VNQLLEKNNMSREDIDYSIFHQANKFMLNTIRKVCVLPKDKFFIDLDGYAIYFYDRESEE